MKALPQWSVALIFLSIAIVLIMSDWVRRYYILSKHDHKMANPLSVRIKVFPKFTTRNIAYIAIMIAISVAFVSILMSTTPLASYPSLRVAIEAIMIKTIGFIFGISLGVISAFITEGLTTLFFPFYPHWGYFVVVCLFAIFAGLAKHVKDRWKDNPNKLTIAVVSSLSLILVFIIVVVACVHGQNIDFNFTKKTTAVINKWIIFGISIVGLSIPILAVFFFKKRMHDNKLTEEKYKTLISVIMFATFAEIFITTFIVPVFDTQILNIPYLTIVTSKIVLIPIKITINTFIVYTTYTTIKPLVRS